MIIQSFFKKNNKKNVLCLGRFDGLHIGHQKVISSAKEYIKDKPDLELFMFTLKRINNCACSILSFEELCYKSESLGVQNVVFAEQTQEFFNISYDYFLNILYENFKPQAVFVGEDYTFGKDRLGTVSQLKAFCKQKNIECFSVKLEEKNGEKVSSTLIKTYLQEGKIEKANELLGGNYFVIGEVVHGRHLGKEIGFPTTNILLDSTKIPIKQGVYASSVIIDGKRYKAMSSFGTAPTFDVNKLVLESYILDFDKEIYGKKIIVELERFLRENKKFSSKEQLINQLKKDVSKI